MKISSSSQMHQIDVEAITKYGIPEIVLMENAGHEVAQEAINMVGEKQKFCIIAGYGNNGGDALVAARHLLNSGAKCKIFLLGNERIDKFTPSARINYNVLVNMEAEIYHIVSERDWNRLQLALTFSDCVIDGLLGTGIHGELSELAMKCIKQINISRCPIISVDIPSGVNADTGALAPIAVKATTTVTLGLPKTGMFMYPGSEFIGKLIIKNIGIPQDLLTSKLIKQEAVTEKFVEANIDPRAKDVHKGSCGKVLVVAGSVGYTGAADLASNAVLRMGAGLCTLLTPESVYHIAASKACEVMVKPLKEIAEGALGSLAKDQIVALSKENDVVLMGPGLGRNSETLDTIVEAALEIDKPLVLDADAIYAFAHHKDKLKDLKHIPIITPHLGEMANFLEMSVAELKADLWNLVRQAANQYNATFVVKSERTITVCPTGEVFVNTSGNPGMATAGCGDVLAGAISAIAAEGVCSKMNIAPIGVYLHGVAGDLSAEYGRAGLLAGDILDNLQVARRNVEKI